MAVCTASAVFGMAEHRALAAEEEDPSSQVQELATVEDAIPAAVKALPEPSLSLYPGGVQMAVSAATEKAQAHVLQGMNHLHGGWEFLASCHFAAAMREDPECLLAHWGMLMALLAPQPETGQARNAAAERLLHLIDAGNGTELERGYAYGIVEYLREGPTAASNAFRKVAARFPNDMQASIFVSLFSRGGYDEFGSPTPDQEEAEKRLLALVEQFPENPIPLHALLTIRAEAPDLKESLPLAETLVQMAPEYAPYHHLLGHYRWRCGEHAQAASALGRAATLFGAWMKENQVSLADCPEWIRAEGYRAVALASKGDFDTAYVLAEQLAATELPEERASSAGARLLAWEGQTLPARLLMRRNQPGDIQKAMASLPKPEVLKRRAKFTLALWWVDGLRIVLDANRLIAEKNLEDARNTADALTFHGERMSKLQGTAAEGGERSAWNRAFRALEMQAAELRGNLALAGPKEGIGSAYNWYRAATDRQGFSTMMQPPLILTPMAARLGEYYLAIGKPQEAVELFREALTMFPNDMNALQGLRNAAEAAKLPEQVEEAEQRIRELKDS